MKAMDARRFVILFAAPFFFGAWRAMRVPASPKMPRRALCVALIFACMLSLQANGWRGLMSRVIAQVEADPRTVIPMEDFAWTHGGPADHWGLGPQVTANLGGRKLVLGEKARAALRETPPRVELGYDAWVSPEPGVIGWFDFREALQR